MSTSKHPVVMFICGLVVIHTKPKYNQPHHKQHPQLITQTPISNRSPTPTPSQSVLALVAVNSKTALCQLDCPTQGLRLFLFRTTLWYSLSRSIPMHVVQQVWSVESRLGWGRVNVWFIPYKKVSEGYMALSSLLEFMSSVSSPIIISCSQPL